MIDRQFPTLLRPTLAMALLAWRLSCGGSGLAIAQESIVPEELPTPATTADETQDGQLRSILETGPDVGEVGREVPSAPPAQPQPIVDAPATEPAARRSPQLGTDFDVLDQGPVHEAFAVPESAFAKNPLVISQPPPAPIDEIPPAAPNGGRNLQWISGYWAFDESNDRFVWVSGLYREVPPDRVWVPGTWSQVADGYVWNSGFWSSAAPDALSYLHAPPAPLEQGPTNSAPSMNSFWIPGRWIHDGGQYQWQTGYWTEQQQDWVWQPACYVARPAGHVYVSGYWDYEPTVRGIAYAPVVFYGPVQSLGAFRYRPVQRLPDPAALLVQMFVREGYRNYFYGDYYNSEFAQIGYRPWYRVESGNLRAASLASYYQWKYNRIGLPFTDAMQRVSDFVFASPGNAGSRISVMPSSGLSLDALLRDALAGRFPNGATQPGGASQVLSRPVTPSVNSPATVNRSSSPPVLGQVVQPQVIRPQATPSQAVQRQVVGSNPYGYAPTQTTPGTSYRQPQTVRPPQVSPYTRGGSAAVRVSPTLPGRPGTGLVVAPGVVRVVTPSVPGMPPVIGRRGLPFPVPPVGLIPVPRPGIRPPVGPVGLPPAIGPRPFGGRFRR